MHRTLRAQCTAIALLIALGAVIARAEEPVERAPWSATLSGGWMDFEGDEPVQDDGFGSLRIGHALDPDWSIEGNFELIPTLEEQFRTDWRTGKRVSRLQEEAGAGVDETSSMRLSVEALRHLPAAGNLEPFLAAGLGAAWYEDDFDEDLEPFAQAGGGCAFRLSDSWALRADLRASLGLESMQFNGVYSFGLQWSPGGGKAATALPVAAPVAATAVAPTPAPSAPAPSPAPVVAVPVSANPDTDGDGLTDADENAIHHTDPLRADTDWDALGDGDEVNMHHTDPLKRDTDGGNVYDGHEVLVDHTDALRPEDDRTLYELRPDFDAGDWKIKAEYFSEIGVIGKQLKTNPDATARIEGHVDATTTTGAMSAQKLSERRASAVRDALTSDWAIAPTRVIAEGLGTSRAKGPDGNPDNERIEVYIHEPTK